MLLKHLSLAYFRSYRRLDLSLEPGLSLFWGDNGQGKSNLLEAAYLLATARSFRTSSERDLIHWHADTTPIFARIAGEVSRTSHTDRLELLIAEATGGVPPGERERSSQNELGEREGPSEPASEALRNSARGSGGAQRPPVRAPADTVRRKARINGQDKPLSHLLGHLNAVLFSPEDVDLVSGPAERRRRYLDITLCQVNPTYLRHLRRYLRILTQRNALLKLARERSVPADEFDYWDTQLTETGAALLVTRLLALQSLNTHLATIYPQLTHAAATLRLDYRSTIELDPVPDLQATLTPEARTQIEHQIAQRYAAQLTATAPRERAQAVTLSGVHRDDAAFIADDIDLRTYGSRGQQRIAALALRLAETAFMRAATGETPVLLLDDVMSELDPTRRRTLQQAIAGHDQVLLTATDLSAFDPATLAGARRFRVTSGEVTLDR